MNLHWLSLAIICTTFFVLPSAATPEKTKQSRVEQEILQLEKARIEALVRNDRAALERILADDLTYTHSSGETETKAEFLARLASGNLKYLSMEHEDVRARTYGNVAVLTGRSKVRVLLAGQERNFQIRFINAYAKRSEGWQMVAWQSTRIAGP